MSQELDNDPLLAPLMHGNENVILGGVLLKAKIGEGGAGTVYSGLHTRLGIPVAIKVLKDTDNLSYFLSEARLTVSIEHPNLVRVYDLNSDLRARLHFIVMEHIDGCSAYELLDKSLRQRGRPLSQASALEIVRSASNAMAVVHERNIVHRDIKPDNILIRSKDGAVKVADLGLACSTQSRSRHEMVGTIGFLSPEVIRGGAATPASDVYALGACLYELCTGKLPFGDMAENYYYECQLEALPPDPRSRGVELDEELCAVIMKCLDRDPSCRFTNAGELAAALQQVSSRLAAPANANTSSSETALMNSPVVMVVDDDVQVLDLMRECLEHSGFRTACYACPQEALKDLAAVRPEAAVVDLRMPAMNGVTLCSKLREVDGFADLPVLMLSGDNENNAVEFALRSGIDDYLVKPLNISDMLLRVRLLTKLRDANRERRKIETQLQTIKRKSRVGALAMTA